MAESVSTPLATRTLNPIELGSSPFLAAVRSISAPSSLADCSVGLSTSSGSASSSIFLSEGRVVGTRYPVRYQRRGDSERSSLAKAWSLSGPTRSSRSASTRRARICSDVEAGVGNGHRARDTNKNPRKKGIIPRLCWHQQASERCRRALACGGVCEAIGSSPES